MGIVNVDGHISRKGKLSASQKIGSMWCKYNGTWAPPRDDSDQYETQYHFKESWKGLSQSC